MKKSEIEKLVNEVSEGIRKRKAASRLELMMMFGNKWSEEYRRQEIDKEQAEYERSFMPKQPFNGFSQKEDC